MNSQEYVIMFDDGSLHVCGLLEAVFINESGIEFEILGWL